MVVGKHTYDSLPDPIVLLDEERWSPTLTSPRGSFWVAGR